MDSKQALTNMDIEKMDKLKEIAVDEIGNLEEAVLIIDIRSKIAFDHGHIPGALSFPEPFDIHELADYIRSFPYSEAAIYCSIGEHSKTIVENLQQNGVTAYNLEGGYREWLVRNYSDYSSILNKNECNQYSRQMVLPEIGQSGQEKLKNAKVLVIGAGALGTIALTYLASAGVGNIGIVDGDIIERSNIHRQMLYNGSDIGRKKAEAAKERLELMNEFISITPYDVFAAPYNIKGLINGYDFVIDATDSIETKFLINDACVIDGIPFCHAGILAFEGQVMTWIPGDYPCYRCIFEDIPDDYIPNCAEAGIIGAMSGIIGSIQALEAIKYITSAGELLVGKMLHIDGLNMATRIIPFTYKNNGCKVCGENADIKDVSKHNTNYRRRHCRVCLS